MKKRYMCLFLFVVVLCVGCDSYVENNIQSEVEVTETIAVQESSTIIEQTCIEEQTINEEISLAQNEDEQEIDLDYVVELSKKYDSQELNDDDFKITYNSVEISREDSCEKIMKMLGEPDGFEDNNFGFISNGNGYRRWNLNYPDYYETQIRFLFLSEEDDEISNNALFIGAYLTQSPTNRGVIVGDEIVSVLDAYGKPDIVKQSDYFGAQFEYILENSRLIFVFNGNTLNSIFIDYNNTNANDLQGV